MISEASASERIDFKMNLKQNNRIKVLACILSFMLVLFTLSGCAEKVEEKVGNSETPSPAPTPTKEQTYQIGEAGRTDNLEIMITKVEKAAEWINGPPEGREYVVVSFKVTNISKEKQSIGADDFQYVRDESGSRESYARTTGVKADPDTFGATDIEPVESFEGSLVYAMPIDMGHIELHYLESYKTALKFEFDK
jgi:hypothetical protein